MKKILFLLVLGVFIKTSTFAQDLSLYQKQIFIKANDTLRYRILYPESFNKRKSYPVIVFLHGSGERGNDNELQLAHGGDLFLKDEYRKKFPAIVIFPQCPADQRWSNFKNVYDSATHTSKRDYTFQSTATTQELLVKSLLDSLEQNGMADKKRMYIGGLSLGGFGTYDMVIRYPDYFAAAFPICGAADIKSYVERTKNIPVWIFHGAEDNSVDPATDRALYKALQEGGAKDFKYTEYPGVGHNSWDNAFAEPNLLPWLFSKHK